MDMVILVLVVFVLAGLGLAFFGLMWLWGESSNVKELRELRETGVEVPAVLVALEPLRGTDTLRAHYDYPQAGGTTGRHTEGISPRYSHAVGDTYTLVRLPRVAKRVQMGTMAAVRKELGEREGYVRSARWMAIAGCAACATAVTGLALLP
ncbi:hypothetical protein M8Z33_33590 [Streptomyces sp. ZAF1911]|uniref:DUF3592 domain-containing protein n=1 Tax=unclassified Streptomyces TaxID=2593676 RepID=UPI00237A0A7C|nr:DUF3592 domain-containing protein [Streptomyces sp. ZAF1911]MDD9381498.1 hypothetical protein [Streptomyces sp. ZAF1911]